MEIVRFELAHLDQVEFNYDYNEIKSKEAFEILYKSMDSESIVVSLIENKKLVAISYIQHMYGDVGEVGNVRTPHLKAKHAKILKQTLQDNAKFFDRVYTLSDPKWKKWHKFMGFEHEGLLRKVWHGKDKDMWAIINEED